jgi:hypothetical protein
MVMLLYVNMMVVSSFYGDNCTYSTLPLPTRLLNLLDHGTWRRMGDSVSALYATGIHCENCNPENSNAEPFFLRELRRRLYCAVYRSDKTLAVFYGRPPMMVSEDAKVLNADLERLDSAGWNMDGKLRPASFSRLRCQLAVFKERLLEQSLAGEKDSDVVRNIE